MFLRNGWSPASPCAQTFETLTVRAKASISTSVQIRLSIACFPSLRLVVGELHPSLNLTQMRNAFHTRALPSVRAHVTLWRRNVLPVRSDLHPVFFFRRRPQHYHPIA